MKRSAPTSMARLTASMRASADSRWSFQKVRIAPDAASNRPQRACGFVSSAMKKFSAYPDAVTPSVLNKQSSRHPVSRIRGQYRISPRFVISLSTFRENPTTDGDA